jgi:hypothetical protein
MSKVSFARDNSGDVEFSQYTPLKAGIYKATIKRASVTESTNGAIGVNFIFLINDQEYNVYNFYLYKTNGEKNAFTYAKWDSLLSILGLSSVSPINAKVKVRKGAIETEEVAEIFKDLAKKEVYVGLYNNYSRYNDNIQKRLEILKFYRAKDKATASEIALLTSKSITDDKLGVQFASDSVSICDNYARDVTPEEAEEFFKQKAEEKKANAEKAASQPAVDEEDLSDQIPF